jgi:endoglucanase
MRKISVLLVFLLISSLLAGCLGSAGSQDDKWRVRKELTSLEVVKLMGNGINLGNTMEAYGHSYLGTDAPVSSYETLWGQPITTREMIKGMKEAGFDTLRIPVAWTNTMKFETGDYTIREDYLDRVEEIINYALDEGMYVIVNDHWDGGWWGMFSSASQETRDRAMEMFISMWKQIAKKYRKYGDRLIFEAANEELGDRFNDTDLCPDGGNLSKDECYELHAKVTQAFVDTVRATGGNNKYRFLLIPGYNTDINATNDPRFKMPVDKVKDKLLLSVHYYHPWGYCGNPSLNRWGSEKDYREQNERLAKMQRFTEMGYGVVFGEYSVAFNQDESLKNNICDYIGNFLNNCDLYGYCPILWDCNGLYRKDICAIPYEEVAELYKSRSYEAQQGMAEEEIRSKAEQALEEAYERGKAQDTSTKVPVDKAIAWIMFNSGDWALMYSVGDKYDPDAVTAGVVPTVAEVTGPSTYTVGLDFTGTMDGYAKSTAFSALGINNGEILFPGYFIDIKEILINGEPYEMKGKPYTTSDDGTCTRANLYNSWVKSIPKEARVRDGDLTGVTPVPLDRDEFERIETITITFDYGP